MEPLDGFDISMTLFFDRVGDILSSIFTIIGPSYKNL